MYKNIDRKLDTNRLIWNHAIAWLQGHDEKRAELSSDPNSANATY